ncbi:MAG: COG1361 S-layer family protein [Halobacteriota archaeon]
MKQRLLSVLLVLALLTTPLQAAAIDDPRFEVYVENPTVTPGTQTELSIQLVNDASEVDEDVRTARNTKVRLESGETPITVNSGTRLLGTVADGEAKTFTASVDVPTNISAGTYRLPLRVTYEHTLDERDTQYVDAVVRVKERARFVVDGTESTVPVDGTGTVSVAMRNVGEEAARDSTVTLTSETSDITFGDSGSSKRFVGAWEPNETRTIEFEASASPSAETRSYALSATVSFEDEDGNDVTSRAVPLGVTPIHEQTFGVRNVQSTLRVGDEGTLSGEVVNTGERQVRNAVVVFESGSSTVSPIETEYAVGDLEAGASAPFEFDAEVSSTAEAGPRQFTVHVRYRDVDDEQRESDPLDVRTTVDPKTPEFGVDVDDSAIAAGSSSRLELTVTNDRDEPLTDISAKLYAESPLSTDDDEAFIERLEPGESETIVFSVSAAGSALEKTYPVKLDFEYDDTEGDTRISDTYQLPVAVSAPEESGLPIPFVVGGLVLVALVGGVFVYSRR